jgi:hypothetical protein
VEEQRRDDVDVRAVVNFLIALAVGCLITFVLVVEIYNYLERNVRTEDAPLPIVAEAGRREPPPPILRVSPPLDLKRFRESEEPRLHGYRWVDKTAGVVAIPIERAIELLAERGLPSRPRPAAPAPKEKGAP